MAALIAASFQRYPLALVLTVAGGGSAIPCGSVFPWPRLTAIVADWLPEVRLGAPVQPNT